ncbi:MAG TPA: hypothetical protein VGO43_15235 [Pyrinomonadaceae bacterium]|jgi:hypothetical protein|nr:hypothetical protein [Pyrinomonadaceae bacterium]
MTPNLQFQRGAIDAGACVSTGWEMVKSNYGLFLGVSIVAVILSGCIPCVSLFIMGPILAGVYYVVLRQMNGEPVEFGMMFKGFDKFVPLMVIGIVQSIPEIIGQGLRIGAQVGQIGLNGNRSGRDFQFFQQSSGRPELLGGIAAGVLIIIAIVAVIFILFAVVWRFLLFFAIPLAMEHDLGAVDAMKLSAQAAMANVGGLIVLFIFEFLISLLGVIMCVIGLFLVAIPILYAANAIAYRMVFPRLEQRFNYNPPPPGSYGDFGAGMPAV